MRRIKRIGEYTCYCSSYKFPHRFGGGKCTGHNIVIEYWNQYYGYGECSGCINCNIDDSENNYCEIVNQVDTPINCPLLQDFIIFNEIKFNG